MRHSGLWEPVGHSHLLVFLLHVAELLHEEAVGTQVPCLKYCNEVLDDATMSTRPSPSKSASWNWNITSPAIEISGKGFSPSLNMPLPFPCCWKYLKCVLVDLATSARTKSKSPSLSMSTTAGQKAPKLISFGKAVLARVNHQLRQFNLTFDPPIRGQFTANKFTYGPQKGHLDEPGRKRLSIYNGHEFATWEIVMYWLMMYSWKIYLAERRRSWKHGFHVWKRRAAKEYT